ncbi:DNA-binding GntR family transcriptional regulator [Dongia mobilis]|uniref:DNA-binding GntR family transcriptional regulator n=1 Tax=Dongia mobilis TaxID=578943 RepID=A0A4R6WS42_9PROT|nr:GntR family transcriptional regulator [Dongia mobilis]TDQ84432.1 DNA-binding GntR family transcriptional regulator [Dongia mobilis]
MNSEAKSYDFLGDVSGPGRGGTTARVVEAIREAIVSLDLPPGTQLDKAALCTRLGVSRFPVSEALSRLQAEGLVEIRPQSGTIVARIRLADVRENLFIRRALEAEAVRSLAGTCRADLLDSLRRNLRYQKAAAEAGDRKGFHVLDLAFHDIIFQALGFERVKAMVESARLGLDRIRRLLSSRRRHELTFQEHEAVLQALAAHDGEAAARAMVAHLDAVMAELLTLAEAQPDIFADQARTQGLAT